MLAGELDATLGRNGSDSGQQFGVRTLLIGDDLDILELLERTLSESGFGPLTMSGDPARALTLFRELDPDLVVLDLDMSGMDATSIVRQLSARVRPVDFLPVVVLATDLTQAEKQSLLGLGVCDIVDRNTGQADLAIRLQNVLRIRDLTAVLEQRVAARTALLRETELELATRLAAAAELCDYGDASHVQRVGRTSALLAAQLGLSPEEVELIRYAAPLHDIGKIAIPEAILLKTDPLTLDEWDVLKTHTTIGAQLLADSISPILHVAEEIALYHHECWDGTGYTGLSGEDIPLVARIVAVADVFDALTHERPFKSAWTCADTVEWMRTMRGQRFDPRVIDALVDIAQRTDLTDLGTEPVAFYAPRVQVAAVTGSR